MDFILKKLDKKIERYRLRQKYSDAAEMYRVKIEYMLILIFSYLWNKNSERIPPQHKQRIIEGERPSIGNIVEFIRYLDVDSEFSEFIKSFDKKDAYTNFRNKHIGHGYRFDGERFLDEISNIHDKIMDMNIPIIKDDILIVLIEEKREDLYIGTKFTSDLQEDIFSVPVKSNLFNNFKSENVYILHNNEYYKITPFIYLEDEDTIYLYRNYNRVSGNFTYNRLFVHDENFTKKWDEFKDIALSSNSYRIVYSNGLITNKYSNNYDNYVNIGNIHTKKIQEFLFKNHSNATCTIWGFGGVGKTATVQYVIEQLRNKKTSDFQFIVFLSAKDRKLNYNNLMPSIENIDDRVINFEQIIKSINLIIDDREEYDEEQILNLDERILIIIDDFETLHCDEQQKVIEFSKKLTVRTHKLIITTRSSHIIGEEIHIQEFNKEESCKFLQGVIEKENKTFLPILEEILKDEDNQNAIHKISLGRPLFLLHLAFILPQKGESILKSELFEHDSVVEFLYGRIFDYLKEPVKETLACLAFICEQNELSGRLQLVKLVKFSQLDNIDLEFDFQAHLDELKKFKLIRIDEDVDEDNKEFHFISADIKQKVETNLISYWNNIDNDRKKLVKGINKLLSQSLSVYDAWCTYMESQQDYDESSFIDWSYKTLLMNENTPNGIRLKALKNYGDFLTEQQKPHMFLELIESVEVYFEKNKYIKFYIFKAEKLWEFKEKQQEAIILLKKTLEKVKDNEHDFLKVGVVYIDRLMKLLQEKSQETEEKFKTYEIIRNEYEEKVAMYRENLNDIMEIVSIINEILDNIFLNDKEDILLIREIKQTTNSLRMFMNETYLLDDDMKETNISLVNKLYIHSDQKLDVLLSKMLSDA